MDLAEAISELVGQIGVADLAHVPRRNRAIGVLQRHADQDNGPAIVSICLYLVTLQNRIVAALRHRRADGIRNVPVSVIIAQ